MIPGSNTESYPAFAHIGLRGKPRKKPQPGKEDYWGGLTPSKGSGDPADRILKEAPPRIRPHVFLYFGIGYPKTTRTQRQKQSRLQYYKIIRNENAIFYLQRNFDFSERKAPQQKLESSSPLNVQQVPWVAFVNIIYRQADHSASSCVGKVPSLDETLEQRSPKSVSSFNTDDKSRVILILFTMVLPLHDIKVTVWCGFRSDFIIGRYFYEEIEN
ncbi:hypothetical protein ANN_18831 [Periplaneta americana]|uniref:Uncharacterized protein n=1 Tax=Periplaneta americana TaxID=6978 RepID=A0ABQ8SR57_PERAM|nr:hypothetical protein ANN_18831 [Periplaneta americana]